MTAWTTHQTDKFITFAHANPGARKPWGEIAQLTGKPIPVCRAYYRYLKKKGMLVEPEKPRIISLPVPKLAEAEWVFGDDNLTVRD